MSLPKLLPFLLLAASAQASTIVARTGSFDAVFSVISNIYAASWTMPSAAKNVTISATINGFTPSSNIQAFLSNTTGPGTIPLQSTAFADNTNNQYVDTILFTGLFLQPGTYYLALQGNNTYWTTSDTPAVTLGLGATLNSDLYSSGSTAALNFSNLSVNNFVALNSQNLLFRVTGDSVPEPSTYALVSVALLGLAIRRR